MKIIYYAITLIVLSKPIFAGTGWYVTFNNQSGSTVTLSPASNDQWYPNDFGKTYTIKAGESKILYTENQETGNGMASMNISGPYNAYIQIVEGSSGYTVMRDLESTANIACKKTPFIIGSDNAAVTPTSFRVDGDTFFHGNCDPSNFGSAYATIILYKPLPAGDYTATCSISDSIRGIEGIAINSVSWDNNNLMMWCKKDNGQIMYANINYATCDNAKVSNTEGALTCADIPNGNYQNSCIIEGVSKSILNASCTDIDTNTKETSLNYSNCISGTIGNENGSLTCTESSLPDIF